MASGDGKAKSVTDVDQTGVQQTGKKETRGRFGRLSVS
jgi:hypothetical protein